MAKMVEPDSDNFDLDEDCGTCNGTGECQNCHGNGEDCESCDATGDCTDCDGSGTEN